MLSTYVIKRPILTEKTVERANTENVFTFEVDRGATKHQIREAIEQLYGVTVDAINTVMNPRVKKASGRKRLKVLVAKWKKAFVKLKPGDKIDLFNTGGTE